jgi:hypothetical protein
MGAQFFPAPKLSRLNHSGLRKKTALLLVALVLSARAIDSRQDAKTPRRILKMEEKLATAEGATELSQ